MWLLWRNAGFAEHKDRPVLWVKDNYLIKAKSAWKFEATGWKMPTYQKGLRKELGIVFYSVCFAEIRLTSFVWTSQLRNTEVLLMLVQLSFLWGQKDVIAIKVKNRYFWVLRDPSTANCAERERTPEGYFYWPSPYQWSEKEVLLAQPRATL